MSHRGRSTQASKVEKDLKAHLLQNLQNNSMLGDSSDECAADDTYQTEMFESKDQHFLNSAYPSVVSPGSKADLQSKMTTGCQEIASSQSQQDAEGNLTLPTLSHKELVESLDRLSSPPPSQLTHMWVRENEGADMCSDVGGQMQYGEYAGGTQEDAEGGAWDERLQRGNLEIHPHRQSLDEHDEQPASDILEEIERSLHEHIDDELNSLRANLHDLVADQQVHLRHYLTPTHYSQDMDDVDIISNQEDFNSQQATLNLEDTGWSSDCMQSSCSTVNEPMKLEEASPDSAVVLQDDSVAQCQQESVAIINRLTEDGEMQTVLIELQTSAAILSHTLRRQEYSTL